MVSSSRSVILDMADTTTATGRLACSSARMRAAIRMRSAEPMLVPPNFMTNRSFKPRSLFSPLMIFLPVCHAGTHQLQNRLLHFVEGEPGGIEVRRVRRLRERCVGARAVALVALLHLGCQSGLGDGVAFGARL